MHICLHISLYVYMSRKIGKSPGKLSTMSRNRSENLWHVWKMIKLLDNFSKLDTVTHVDIIVIFVYLYEGHIDVT